MWSWKWPLDNTLNKNKFGEINLRCKGLAVIYIIIFIWWRGTWYNNTGWMELLKLCLKNEIKHWVPVVRDLERGEIQTRSDKEKERMVDFYSVPMVQSNKSCIFKITTLTANSQMWLQKFHNYSNLLTLWGTSKQKTINYSAIYKIK
jgi:hypothetical protein